ncbi:MAG: ABC transporter permease [Oscillospiraceae bacterium]|nr:ABC transporter permease [Oscillospiraceae bacterium]
MNKILAIFKKQLKDTLKNKVTLLQFVLFPVMAFFLTEFIAKGTVGLPENYFVIMFGTMYAGLVPLVNMAVIISEEREKYSLKMLIMCNVKPFQYLVGVGAYVLILCTFGAVAFALIGGYSGVEALRFVLIMVLGFIASILLGSAIGIFSKNQGASTALAMPIAMIAGFVPMISMFNEKFASISKILYTQQISFLAGDLSLSNFTFQRFLIIGINMILFLAVFIYIYKRIDLKE